LTYVDMTSEPGGPFSDTFLTGMHLALITGDRFCADFAHLKQAYCQFAVWEVTGLTAVPVHFHGYKVGKTRVTGCLERGIIVTIPAREHKGETEKERSETERKNGDHDILYIVTYLFTLLVIIYILYLY